MVWLIIIGLIIAFIWFSSTYLAWKDNAINFIIAQVKGGKTLFCVWRCIVCHRKVHFCWWFKRYILRKKVKDKDGNLVWEEEPYLYANMPIKYKYWRKLERDIILRKKRPTYKSVCLVDESSLLADSMDIRDEKVNNEIKMFNKLFGHETHGGILYYNTQNFLDNHYNVKRCGNCYWEIVDDKKFFILPFHCLKLKQRLNSNEGENINVNNTNDLKQDKEYSRWLLVPKWYYHKYDRYGLSVLTDDLEVSGVRAYFDENGNKLEGLKYNEVITFKEGGILKRGKK